MDLTFPNLFSQLSEKEEVRILMVGLDAAGKTTILYKLKLGGVDTPIPANAFNVETVQYNNVLLTVWNLSKIRPPWRHYFHITHALIFVVDSNNRDTVDEARRQLHRILLEDELTDAAVLIFANKTDLPTAMNTAEITSKLRFNEIQQCHKHIQRACATSGDGLYEGLNWLSNKIKDIKTSKPRKVLSHMFLPEDCDFINMLQIIRAGGDLGHDSVTATDPYKDHPGKIFGKLKPSIILRDEFCMNVNRVKGTQGFMRGVATGGRWKAYGGKHDVKKNDKKIGESTELEFYEPREGGPDKLTSWRMREFDTCPKNTDEGANCKTICVVFNKESRIRKVYEELKSLISPQEKTKADKGKNIVQDGVREKKKYHEKTQITDRLKLGAGARDVDIPLSVYRDSYNSAKGNVCDGESSSVSGVRVYETRSRSSVALKFLNDVTRRSRTKVSIKRSEVGKVSSNKDMALKWIGKAKRVIDKPNDRAGELEERRYVVETETDESDHEVDLLDDSDTIAQAEETAIWVLDTLSKQRKGETAAVVDTNNENSTEAARNGVRLTFTNLFSLLSDHEVRILMVGLEAAGKTTILNKLKLEEVVSTTPINAFNMKTFHYKNLIITVWDVGKVDMYSQSHQPWRQYFQNIDGVIFVVDSSESADRIEDASRELHKMLKKDELANAAVLVFANKNDRPNAMESAEISACIHFNELQQYHKHIESSCAISGDGLYRGMDWLTKTIKAHRELL